MSIHQPLDQPGAIRNGIELDDRADGNVQNTGDLVGDDEQTWPPPFDPRVVQPEINNPEGLNEGQMRAELASVGQPVDDAADVYEVIRAYRAVFEPGEMLGDRPDPIVLTLREGDAIRVLSDFMGNVLMLSSEAIRHLGDSADANGPEARGPLMARVLVTEDAPQARLLVSGSERRR